MVIRNCEYCEKEFQVKSNRSNKKTCSNTCRTYKSLVNTGKKEPLIPSKQLENLVPIIQPSENHQELIQEIQNQLKQLQAELIKLEQENKGLTSLIRKNDTYRLKQAIEDHDYLIKHPRTNEDKIPELKAQLSKDQANLEELEKKIKAAKERRAEIEILIPGLKVQGFRLIEKQNNFLLSNLPKGKLISGEIASVKSKFRTLYPFDEIKEFSDMEVLGKPPKPFICSIFGKSETGKTGCAFAICRDLIQFFNASILYVVDISQMGVDFEDRASKKLNFPELYILEMPNKIEITKTLSSKDFEFLIIDQSNAFHVDYLYLHGLQKQFPNLSIFCVSSGSNVSIRKKAHITIEVRNGVGKAIKGGYQDGCIFGWDDKGISCEHFYYGDEEYQEYN